MSYKKFSDFVVFDAPDLNDYIVGYRELGGEFRSTIKSLNESFRKFSSPSIPNTIFVNISGNDNEVGNSEGLAFRTIKRALAKALEISRNIDSSSKDFESQHGWGTKSHPVNVFIRAGEYIEDNPLYVPPGVSVVAEGKGSVVIKPKNKFYDIFWVNNETSIQNIEFKEYYAPAYAIAYPEFAYVKNNVVQGYPSTRTLEATARADYFLQTSYYDFPATRENKSSHSNLTIDSGSTIYDPFEIAFLDRYYSDIKNNDIFFTKEENLLRTKFWQTNYFNLSGNIDKPYIFTKPAYILNCSTYTEKIPDVLDAGGTAYIDGSKIDGVFRTMTLESCESFNQGGKGIHVTNNGEVHLIDNNTICCTEGIFVENGGKCITNGTNCSFGLSGIVALGKSTRATMKGTLKYDVFSGIPTNSITVTNLGSPDLSAFQDFPNAFTPYFGQVFEIVDANYFLNSSGINYLSATNSGNYFSVKNISKLRPAVFPAKGYECDIELEEPYLLNEDTSVIGKTYVQPSVDALFSGSSVLFYIRSVVQTASQSFNYIGSGTSFLSCSPQTGLLSNNGYEIAHDQVGHVLYITNNESGYSKFGDDIIFNQIDGTITANNISINNNLSANSISVLSASIDVLDIKNYEVSGFKVTGDLTINNNLSAKNTIYSNTIYSSTGVFNNLFSNNATIYGNVSASGVFYGDGSGITNLTASMINDGRFLAVSGGSLNGPFVVNVDSLDDAVRITQRGFGNALVVEDENSPDTTPFIVDYDGNVCIGTYIPLEKLTISGNVSASGFYYGDGSRLINVRDDGLRSLSGTWNDASTVVQNNSAIWAFGPGGDPSSLFLALTGGRINGDLYVNSNSLNTALRVRQTGLGNAFLVEDQGPDISPFLIDSDGNVCIGTYNPSEKLTVSGNVSASGFYYGDGSRLINVRDDGVRGLSANWDSVYTSVKNTSANWDSTYTSVKDTSANWDSVYTEYNSNSADYTKFSYVDGKFLPLSGGIVTGATTFNNDVNIYGNLSARGTSYFLNTVYTTSSALSVVNYSSGPALYVGNNGNGDLASFYDLDGNVEVFHIGGANGSYPNVGVKTSEPNKDFTVNGEISAYNNIWTGGNFISAGKEILSIIYPDIVLGISSYTSTKNTSANWNSVYNNVNSASANWNNVYSTTNVLSSNWDSVYNNVNLLSSRWESTYTDVSNTSANWNSVYSNVNDLSSNWNSVYSNVNAASANLNSVYNNVNSTSANWNSVYNNSNLLSSRWESVYSSVLGISGNWNSVYNTTNLLSSNWDSVYSNVNSTSANLNSVYNNVNLLSSKWESTYTDVSNASANWNSVYTVVNTNSATAWNYQGTDLKNLSSQWVGGNDAYTNLVSNSAAYLSAVDLSFLSVSANWNSVYSNVNSSSANWNSVYNTTNLLSSNWNSVYTSTKDTSGNWNSVYNNVNPLSSRWESTYTDVSNTSANWDSVYTSTRNVSSNWDSVYSIVNSNSATEWNYQGTDLKNLSSQWVGGNDAYTNLVANSAAYLSGFDLSFLSVSANWNSVYSNVNSSSANWNSVYSDVNNLSSRWESVYTDVSFISSNWNSVYNNVNTLSSNWDSVYSNVNATSANLSSVYNNVNSTSANWNSVYNNVNVLSSKWESVYTDVSNASANWDIAYTNLITNSAAYLSGYDLSFLSVSSNWDSVYSTVNSNSATAWNYQGTDLKNLSSQWVGGNDAYTNLVANSAAYLSGFDLSFLSVSANWNSTHFTVNSLSSNWNSVYTSTKDTSGNWDNTYTSVNSNSAKWESVYTTTYNNSATYVTTVATNTPGTSAVTSIVAVSALPTSPNPNILYIVI